MPNSNTRSIQVGSVDNTLLATVYNTDGSIKADLAFDTTGISIFVQRIGEANGSALTLSAKATPQTAHADGAFLNLGGGDISVDVPDAPFATYKGRARIYGTFTGGTIIGEWFDVVGFDASVVAVGANTVTPLDETQTQQAAAAAITQAGLLTGNLANGSLAKTVRDSKSADVLFEGQIVTAAAQSATLNGDATTVCVGQAITIGEEGDIERQTRWVTAFDPDTKIVTLDMPWCVVPGDGADYQIKVLRRSINETQTQAAAAAAITAAALETEQDAAERQTAVLAAIDGIEGGGEGDWAIRRTFQLSGGATVPGVQMSIVGVAGKVDTTGSNGVAQINIDNGTFTLRVTTPSGYEAVADSSVAINNADSVATVTLTREAVPVLVSSSGTMIRRPSVNRRGNFMTLASVVDHLLAVEEINPGEARAVERAVSAAQSALLSLTSHSTQGFRYYQGRSKLIMPGTLNLGTVTVSSGLVTGTFSIPSWADLGHLRVGQHSYAVVGQDGIGGIFVDSALPNGTYTSAILEQVFFPLPKNFRRRGRISDRANQLDIEDLSGSVLQSLYDHLNWINNSGRNRSFSAITVDQRYQGELMLMVWPPYPNRTELDLFYERYPEPLDVHRTPIASLGVSGNVATAVSAVFTDNHVGCAITIGANNDIEITKPLSSASLVEAQRIILRVNSATEAVLDANVSDSAISNRAAYVSDVVDVLKGPMSEAYLRLAEYELLRQARHKSAQLRQKEFIEQLAIAMQDDNRSRESPGDMTRSDGHFMWGDTTYN